MTKRVISQIEFEIDQLEQLLEAYADLLARAKESKPGLIEVTAQASVLHSFYNGLENIFLSIAKGIEASVPTGSQWHRDLLTQMAEPMPPRDPILTPETVGLLAGYLGFRHFYRHSYSFFLDWDEMEKLVLPLSEVWARVKAELQLFLSKLGPN